MQNWNMKNLEHSSEIYKNEKLKFKQNFMAIAGSCIFLILVLVTQLVFGIVNASDLSTQTLPPDLVLDKTTIWYTAIFPGFWIALIIWVTRNLFKAYKSVEEFSDFTRINRHLSFFTVLFLIAAFNSIFLITGLKAFTNGEIPKLDTIITFPSWVGMVVSSIIIIISFTTRLVFVRNIRKIIYKFAIAKSSEDMKIFMDQNKDMFKDSVFPFGPGMKTPETSKANEGKTSEEIKQYEQNLSKEQKKRAINEEKLNNLTLGELRSLAKKQHIFGTQTMNRKELIEVLLNSIED